MIEFSKYYDSRSLGDYAITMLSGAGVKFIGKDFSNTRLKNAIFLNGIFVNTSFKNADLSNAQLKKSCYFYNVDLDGAKLDNTNWQKLVKINIPEANEVGEIKRLVY